MRTYIIVTVIFAALGIYLFAIFRWWFGQLTALAARYDIPERRKRAARRYLVLIWFIIVPMLGALLGSLASAPKHVELVVTAYICSLVPPAIYWCRKIPNLSTLGYGRQRK